MEYNRSECRSEQIRISDNGQRCAKYIRMIQKAPKGRSKEAKIKQNLDQNAQLKQKRPHELEKIRMNLN